MEPPKDLDEIEPPPFHIPDGIVRDLIQSRYEIACYAKWLVEENKRLDAIPKVGVGLIGRVTLG